MTTRARSSISTRRSGSSRRISAHGRAAALPTSGSATARNPRAPTRARFRSTGIISRPRPASPASAGNTARPIRRSETLVVPAERKREPGPILPVPSIGHEVWVPAFRLRAPRFGGLEPAEARTASEGRVARTTRLPNCLLQKFFRGIQRPVIVEIVVIAARKAHEALRLVGEREQLFTECNRHGAVERTVHNQERRLHLADPLIGAELVLHQQPHRRERIGPRSDIGGGGKRRIENERGGRLLCRERDRNAAADRLAPEHELAGRIARRGKVIERERVGNEALLTRASVRTGIAAIRQRQKARAVGNQRLETRHAMTRGPAIALEIENDRMPLLRLHV